ncbi:MAG: hypothetical protein WCI71_05785 [Bacteroidota bacterium]
MKTKLLFFSTVMIALFFAISSCTSPNPTVGTLTITVYNPSSGALIVGEQVYLATSLTNLKQGIYIRTAWTNNFGLVYFGDLTPGFYFYDTEHWEDYGATQLYAGLDFYVHLYVNTPAVRKK